VHNTFSLFICATGSVCPTNFVDNGPAAIAVTFGKQPVPVSAPQKDGAKRRVQGRS